MAGRLEAWASAGHGEPAGRLNDLWAILLGMSDLLPTERLQPCLLDRLTDHEPDNPKESREHRVMSLRQYRQAVLRDLSWLLNSTSRAGLGDMDGFPHAIASVVNFGIIDLAGMSASAVNPAQFERMVIRCIQDFEPRILRSTLRVEVSVDPTSMGHNSFSFTIHGDLWAQPVPEAMLIRSDVDFETGACVLRG